MREKRFHMPVNVPLLLHGLYTSYYFGREVTLFAKFTNFHLNLLMHFYCFHGASVWEIMDKFKCPIPSGIWGQSLIFIGFLNRKGHHEVTYMGRFILHGDHLFQLYHSKFRSEMYQSPKNYSNPTRYSVNQSSGAPLNETGCMNMTD